MNTTLQSPAGQWRPIAHRWFPFPSHFWKLHRPNQSIGNRIDWPEAPTKNEIVLLSIEIQAMWCGCIYFCRNKSRREASSSGRDRSACSPRESDRKIFLTGACGYQINTVRLCINTFIRWFNRIQCLYLPWHAPDRSSSVQWIMIRKKNREIQDDLCKCAWKLLARSERRRSWTRPKF
jgi:hypothetical protein